MNEITINKVKIEFIEEELPFLVAGESATMDTMVFGFPYVYKKTAEDGKSKYCYCIIIPNKVEGVILEKNPLMRKLYQPYFIAFKKDEFHPIKGELHKFVRKENDTLIFEDDIRIEIKSATHG